MRRISKNHPPLQILRLPNLKVIHNLILRFKPFTVGTILKINTSVLHLRVFAGGGGVKSRGMISNTVRGDEGFVGTGGGFGAGFGVDGVGGGAENRRDGKVVGNESPGYEKELLIELAVQSISDSSGRPAAAEEYVVLRSESGALLGSLGLQNIRDVGARVGHFAVRC